MRFATLCLFLCSSMMAGAAPKSIPAATSSSPEATVQDFFSYLLAAKHDLSTDGAAQKRWLTQDLRRALASTIAATSRALKAHPDEKIDAPDNSTFLGAWDAPTTFKVAKSNAAAPEASVEVMLTWGPKTNYPGEVQKRTVALVLEEGAWRIKEITIHPSKFAQAGTLTGELRALSRAH